MKYGCHQEQYAELTVPDGATHGTAVIIHGGFWRANYDLGLGRPLAADLSQRGWATLNVEYRRTGTGGGWPQTFEDIGTAIDQLAGVDGLNDNRVVTIGHSAGGLLALWAAMRTDAAVPVSAAISQAGVLDLAGAAHDELGDGAVTDFLGDHIGQALDPILQPPATPVWCLHAPDDDRVPINQSQTYVAAATKRGMPAEFVEVTGGHFGLIDPAHEAWSTTRRVLETISGTAQ